MPNQSNLNPEQQFSELLAAPYDEANVQLCLAAVEDENAPPEFQKVQLSQNAAEQFRIVIARQMELTLKRATRGDLRLLKYDAGAMNRSDEIEYLTPDTEPGIWDQFAAAQSLPNLPVFNAADEFINRLHFYVIIADLNGEQALFFRFYTPQNELSRSSTFGFRLSNTVFNEIREPTFLFDMHLDCAVFRNVLYIFKKNNFQRIFRYFERVREAGREALRIVSQRVKIDNFEQFAALVEGQLNMLAKLKNIAAKEYLQRVTMKDIKRVIKQFKLSAAIVAKDGEERLIFDPEAKDKWLILRILDDDYLGSVMTKLKYEANSKRALPT
jgi:hypothetical protein